MLHSPVYSGFNILWTISSKVSKCIVGVDERTMEVFSQEEKEAELFLLLEEAQEVVVWDVLEGHSCFLFSHSLTTGKIKGSREFVTFFFFFF